MSWTAVDLPTICRPKQWPTIPKAKLFDSGYPVYGANGRIGFYSDFNHEEPTILITCRGATCGTINVCEPRSYVTGNAMALDDLDHERVDLRFMTYALQNADFSSIITGVAQPQITRQSLSRLQIPLPPLADQKRIADILDKADALREQRREALAQLDTLLQSTFLDMFGDPVTNPMGWEVVRLEDVATRITKGASPKWQGFDYQDNGVLFVTSENVRQGFIDISKPKYVSADFHTKLSGSQLRTGDLLINLVGASIGRSCVFTQYEGKANVNQAVGVVSINEPLFASYLLQLLQTNQGKTFLTGKIVEAARANISLKNLRGLMFPAPPRELQQRFAGIVKSIEQQKARMRSHLDELDTLFASLQSRAFGGEL